jgi:hypothetical protein
MAAQWGLTMVPTLGELRFAQTLFATEMAPRRRRDDELWNKFFNFAVVTTFVFFLFM